MPLGYLDDHHYALRFLNSYEWDYDRAYQAILKKEDWLKQTLIPALEDFSGAAELQN